MPRGGSLDITLRRENDHVQITFSDTGVDISPENMKNIFNPFFTTKSKGMGLGLAICKRIIESHHGTISVQSELGKGTSFAIRIPYRQNGAL